MALRGDRKITDGVDISFFMNETAERGEVVIFSTVGSGAAMDDPTAVVATPAATLSGQRIAGLLLNDMVNLDLTRQHINQHKDEVQQGGKVSLLRHGVVTTNVVDTGSAGVPVAGGPAYLGRGTITPGGTQVGWATSTPVVDFGDNIADYNGSYSVVVGPGSGININKELYRIGTFLSTRDSDGYAKLEVDIR